LILPELIRQNHAEHCAALQLAHDSSTANPNAVDLSVLHALVTRLLGEQMATAACKRPLRLHKLNKPRQPNSLRKVNQLSPYEHRQLATNVLVCFQRFSKPTGNWELFPPVVGVFLDEPTDVGGEPSSTHLTLLELRVAG
jgi:hypothetical protein